MRSPSPPGRRSPRSRALASLACLTALTACGPAQQTALPGSPGPTRSSATARDTPGPNAPTSTSEVDVRRDGIEPAVVTGVRYARHRTYDRVVIDLDGEIPGYNVRWVDEFVEDGSGRPIEIRGGAYLLVTLFPSNAHDEDGTPTWEGGPIYHAGLRNLTDVVRTGDFEARVGIGLVLDRRAAFQIQELEAPSRLVVDVAH
ncbi:hypothetical protein E1267_04440 [Nonomuraea longispora]|uniref:AMIN-like domain-containing protein n=1 Tax=Nonomuraea longispora TaxID=1848320 RepID=A0A4R4NM04_9ACTN|nr:hypothetical protein [Nonomuraea longispora]TDC10451.1 hypothetical protein E1267_04440 [Nonomuraea longispora]